MLFVCLSVVIFGLLDAMGLAAWNKRFYSILLYSKKQWTDVCRVGGCRLSAVPTRRSFRYYVDYRRETWKSSGCVGCRRQTSTERWLPASVPALSACSARRPSHSTSCHLDEPHYRTRCNLQAQSNYNRTMSKLHCLFHYYNNNVYITCLAAISFRLSPLA